VGFFLCIYFIIADSRLEGAAVPLNAKSSPLHMYVTGFQFWDTLQAICTYVCDLFTSQAVFRGIGVGKEVTARPLASCCKLSLVYRW
jgi:hypothetical protein